LSLGTDSPVSTASSARRHLVAGGQQHDVARHELLGGDQLPLAAAQHRGLRREHAADGVQRRLGLAFLHEADEGVDDHRAQQHAGVDPVPQPGGDGGRHQHHVDQHVVELRQQPQPCGPARRRGQAVGAVHGQAPRGLGVGQAVLRVGGQALGGGAGGQGVPGGVAVSGRWCRWHAVAACPALRAPGHAGGGGRSGPV
jgi:hypothetical protein